MERATRHLLRHLKFFTCFAIIAMALNAKAEESSVFEFALVGDTPYSAREERLFQSMMTEIDESKSEFVIHVGDFKSSSMACTDALYFHRRDLFDRSRHPFIFLFGDNDWTDCERNRAARTHPEERLRKLRELFTANDESLGQLRLSLTRQSENPQYTPFRENVRWQRGGVYFVGLHVVGSDNNWGDNDNSPSAEYETRNAATLTWLRESFAVAKRDAAVAIVIAMQADPAFNKKQGHRNRRGFDDLLSLLAELSLDFVRPVLLAHGDTHWFRVDKPLHDPTHPDKLVENLTRVETFGSPLVNWVSVRVDPDSPSVFTIKGKTEP